MIVSSCKTFRYFYFFFTKEARPRQSRFTRHLRITKRPAGRPCGRHVNGEDAVLRVHPASGRAEPRVLSAVSREHGQSSRRGPAARMRGRRVGGEGHRDPTCAGLGPRARSLTSCSEILNTLSCRSSLSSGVRICLMRRSSQLSSRSLRFRTSEM